MWHELLAGAIRRDLTSTRETLAILLDGVAADDEPPVDYLATVTNSWLRQKQESKELGWRFVFARYDCMREGDSGLYVAAGATLGYSICMLRRTQLNSWYRDPFLLAIWRESAVGSAVDDPWFTGPDTTPRWMRLNRSGTRMRCIEEGIVLQRPSIKEHAATFDSVCRQHKDIVESGEEYLLVVPQGLRDGTLIDTQDRVQMGAALLKHMAQAGL